LLLLIIYCYYLFNYTQYYHHSTLSDDNIVEKIRETHMKLRTFEAKGETVSLLRMNKTLIAGVQAINHIDDITHTSLTHNTLNCEAHLGTHLYFTLHDHIHDKY
jgi:hypothetical protein